MSDGFTQGAAFVCDNCKRVKCHDKDSFIVRHGCDWTNVCSSSCLSQWNKSHQHNGKCCINKAIETTSLLKNNIT